MAGPEVGPGNSAVLDDGRDAIREGSQLRLAYFSAQRDSISHRDVDPLRLYSLDNTWYFEAYCHSAQGLRNFRLDRIETLQPNGRPVSRTAGPAEGFPAKLSPRTTTTPWWWCNSPARAPASPTTTTPNGQRPSRRRPAGRDPVRQHGVAAHVRRPAWRRRPDPGAGGPRGGRPGAGSTRPWPATAARLLSMPWWSWILIWIALVALSLLFYVLLGIRLFRQFMATMKDLGGSQRSSVGRCRPGPHCRPAAPVATHRLCPVPPFLPRLCR